jgi:predicted metal-dependent HD superfamily phosphohydrolase
MKEKELARLYYREVRHWSAERMNAFMLQHNQTFRAYKQGKNQVQYQI